MCGLRRDGVSEMVGQALAEHGMDSDTAWVEGAILGLKHKDGQFI